MRIRDVLRAACGAIVVAASLVAAPSTPAHAAPSLPDGFVLTDYPTGQGQFNLTDFTYLPDGSVLSTGKNGRITWLDPGVAPPRPVADLAVFNSGDSGLLGIAIASDFADSRHVYTTRAVPTGSGFVWRLSRWAATGTDRPTGLTAEQTILQLPGNSDIHGMSGIEVGDDGTLWLSMGDSGSASYVDTRALRAQDLDSPYGKLFHLTPAGNGVATNPTTSPRTPARYAARCSRAVSVARSVSPSTRQAARRSSATSAGTGTRRSTSCGLDRTTSGRAGKVSSRHRSTASCPRVRTR